MAVLQTIGELRATLDLMPNDAYVSIKTESYGFWEIERIETISNRGKIVTVTFVVKAVAAQADATTSYGEARADCGEPSAAQAEEGQ